MAFRYFLISTSGDITGTNDKDSLPDVDSSEDTMAIIDVQAGTYSNDDEDDAVIQEYEPEDDDDDDSTDADLNT